jgi:hypothetical protein
MAGIIFLLALLLDGAVFLFKQAGDDFRMIVAFDFSRSVAFVNSLERTPSTIESTP